jgi:hypothetical protein
VDDGMVREIGVLSLCHPRPRGRQLNTLTNKPVVPH